MEDRVAFGRVVRFWAQVAGMSRRGGNAAHPPKCPLELTGARGQGWSVRVTTLTRFFTSKRLVSFCPGLYYYFKM